MTLLSILEGKLHMGKSLVSPEYKAGHTAGLLQALVECVNEGVNGEANTRRKGMKTLSKPLRMNASFCKEDSVVVRPNPNPLLPLRSRLRIAGHDLKTPETLSETCALFMLLKSLQANKYIPQA